MIKEKINSRIRTVIFGSGQVGQMIARLLGIEYHVLCFADNAPDKWETNCLEIPVCSPEDSLTKHPDLLVLGVLDIERQTQMKEQMHELGYRGNFLTVDSLRIFDPRAAVMRLLAEQIHRCQIPGDVAELGVFRGDFSVLLQEAFPNRILHLFDTFEGFHKSDVATESAHGFSSAREGDFSATSEELVRSRMHAPENVRIHKGWFPTTFSEVSKTTFSFVSLDADLYEPTAAALPLFYEALSPGGVLLIHDVYSTQFSGCRKAVDEFCQEQHIFPCPVSDLHGSAVLRKP